jgi:hypothetical protein
VLVRLLREEYPADYRLAKMAYIFATGVTDEELAALERIEGGGPYLWPNRSDASATNLPR